MTPSVSPSVGVNIDLKGQLKQILKPKKAPKSTMKARKATSSMKAMKAPGKCLGKVVKTGSNKDPERKRPFAGRGPGRQYLPDEPRTREYFGGVANMVLGSQESYVTFKKKATDKPILVFEVNPRQSVHHQKICIKLFKKMSNTNMPKPDVVNLREKLCAKFA